MVGLLKDYLPDDNPSLGYAVHLAWKNPQVEEDASTLRQKAYGGRMPDTVRVGTVQFMQRRVSSFEEFIDVVAYFVDVVADYSGDFVVFPEMFTLQLLSMEDQELSTTEAIEELTKYTPRFKEALRDLAIRYNINIIGGSHPTRVESGRVENISHIFLRDGSVHEQPKIHPTPNEDYWWNIEGGNSLHAIDTACGPIGVLICYDSEFPELARHLTDQGIQILFVPFCTDERQSYLRVRYCCQARGREPGLRCHVGQCRQPAQGGQHGYPIRPELHSHPLRFPLRTGWDRRRHHTQRRDGRDCRPAATHPGHRPQQRHGEKPARPPP
ncbi:MAG: nitrilase-related carbon-nitrogen hydrolase [Candidatus Sedimenticola endophacoides]